MKKMQTHESTGLAKKKDGLGREREMLSDWKPERFP
jgi:hypothetical protein